jgi:hypothetical protein
MGVLEKSRYKPVAGFKQEDRHNGKEDEQGRNGAEHTSLLN